LAAALAAHASHDSLAVDAIAALGTAARGAAPALVAVLDTSTDRNLREHVARPLGANGAPPRR